MPRKNAAGRSDQALAADVIKKPTGLRELSPTPITAKSAANTRPPNPHWTTGSWRGKAAAVSGLSGNDATLIMTAPASPGHNRSASTSAPRLSRTLTMGKSGPAIATPTKLNVTTNGRGDIMDTSQEDKMERLSLRQEKDVSAIPQDERVTTDGGGQIKKQEEVTSNSLWSGWFGTATAEPQKGAVRDESQDVTADQEDQNNGTQPSATTDDSLRVQSIPPPEAVPLPPDPEPRQQQQEAGNSLRSTRSARPRSWLGLWSGSIADTPNEAKESATGALETQPAPAQEAAEADTSATVQQQPLDPIDSTSKIDYRSSWFGLWSGATTQISNAPISGDQTTEAQITEPPVAAAPQGTQAPEPPLPSAPGYASWAYWSSTQGETRTTAQSEVEPEQPAIPETVPTTPSKQTPTKTSTPVSSMSSASSVAAMSAALWEGVSLRGQPAVAASLGNEQRLDTGSVETLEITTAKDVATNERRPPNVVLPQVQATFVKAEPVTYKGQLWSLGRSAVVRAVSRRASLSNPQHVNLQSTPIQLKKAVVIGVHGFFPTLPMWRKVFGPPTGTSVRFAHGAAAAVEAWTKAQGYSCDIEKVALEGEGMIADRLENLWKLLSSSLTLIGKADLVVIASHSQGVPVSMMLMARLLEGRHVSSQGRLTPRPCQTLLTKNPARLAVTSMAGISLGPFSSLQSRFLSPPNSSAGELFDFATVTSTVSTAYTSALRTCLSHTPNAVRVALIGSIDDQLVSLESSLFNTVSHPYIFRAVFVDGNIHAPNFLTHLVAFALKVRNFGGSDHGLVRELSNPLAGSLYGGAGHSTIYQEQAVYDLGISWALDSADLPATQRPELVIQADYEPATTASNPYLLPWAMRGLLEEDVVKTKLQEEAKELVKQFDEWKPVTKVLKDVKFRLEAVKTKL